VLIATPIGNLEDLSPRAVRTLREARLIAAEDTRVTRKLLTHFDLHTSLTSYFEHNKLSKLDSILAALAQGDVALVSDAGTPAINDLLGGQIPMSFNNGPESVGQLAAGSVRALAVTTASRASFLPDVPSMAETVPGYDTEVWWGLLGPAGMPPDLVAKLSHDFVAALNTDSVTQRLSKLGASPIGSSPGEFDAKIHADYDKWGPIIKAAGMKAE